jgi:hypothetical protein
MSLAVSTPLPDVAASRNSWTVQLVHHAHDMAFMAKNANNALLCFSAPAM